MAMTTLVWLRHTYLKVLISDINYELLSSTFEFVTSASEEDDTQAAYEDLSILPITIDEPGYVYIYLSSEYSTPVDVFFDYFEVELTQTPIVQKYDYYSFGLSFNSYTKPGTIDQNFKYNGNEEQNDLGLGLVDFNARFYDQTLGRFVQADPAADDMNQLDKSPFQYAWNNPILLNDPDGRNPVLPLVALYEILVGAGLVGVGTAGLAYEIDRSKLKTGTEVRFNEGQGIHLSGPDPNQPDFKSAKKVIMIGTAIGLLSQIVAETGKFIEEVVNLGEFRRQLETMSEQDLRTFIGAMRGNYRSGYVATDEQTFGYANPELVLSATEYRIKSDIYSLERGLSEEQKKAEEQEKNKGKKANDLLSTPIGESQQGTYKWDGNNWILE